MKLTYRQKVICENIPNVSSLADVGCDHGKISFYAATNGIKKVYATDISRPSLRKAEELCKNLNNVTCIATDGLKDVPKVDCVLICGMGGMEIIDILKSAKYHPKYLLLQPMRDSIEVRKYLIKEYKVVKDFTFIDKNKFYDLILLQKGKGRLTSKEIIFGKTNLKEKSDDFIKLLKKTKDTKQRLLDKGINVKENQKMIKLIESIYED